jgi:hypothetical protein
VAKERPKLNNSANNFSNNSDQFCSINAIQTPDIFCNIKARIIAISNSNKSISKNYSVNVDDYDNKPILEAYNLIVQDSKASIVILLFNKEILINTLQINSCYEFINFKVILVNEKDVIKANNEFKLLCMNDSSIIAINNISDIPKIAINLSNCKYISQIAQVNSFSRYYASNARPSYFDIIGVIIQKGDLLIVSTKNNGIQLEKLDIILGDESNYAIRITFWTFYVSFLFF